MSEIEAVGLIVCVGVFGLMVWLAISLAIRLGEENDDDDEPDEFPW